VGALADKTVAAYVNQHFIATYLKVGTFEIVGGQKVGGNVASYFCLPDSSVLHAVAGPVDAKKFLSELRWAVETRKAAQTASTNLATGAFSQAQYRGYISQAHEERYFAENPGTWGGNVTFTRAKTPQMVVRNLAMMPPQLPRTASQQAQVEWLLARGPLTALEHVYPVIWEQVLGEKLSTLPVAQH
jgi:hypothetical protein